MTLLRVGGLPREPLAAAAQFYGEALEAIRRALAETPDHLVIAFDPADYTHKAWRLAAVQQLARDHAPVRVNALAGGDEKAIAAALAYLGTAEGVTGQYLPLDGNGAAALLSKNG
ncbi:Rossmann fold domain-containing protein [Novosphingobium sp. PS1R-30]|uniref:Rossmann fold domain-containing protein n=1 Tax=Novosphingobium anseongense TaxID=3133436 RepID=A0ABU8S022_9SPHN